MSADLVTILMEEAKKRPELGKPNLYSKYLNEIFGDLPVPEPGNRSVKVKSRNIKVIGSGDYPSPILSVRRILRNDSVYYEELSDSQKKLDAVLSFFGCYADAWVRRLAADQGMVRLMHSSPQPYIILAELESVDKTSGLIARQPLVIIPRVEDKRVGEWEAQNIFYTKKGLLRVSWPLKKEEYARISAYQSRTPSETSPAHLPRQNP